MYLVTRWELGLFGSYLFEVVLLRVYIRCERFLSNFLSFFLCWFTVYSFLTQTIVYFFIVFHESYLSSGWQPDPNKSCETLLAVVFLLGLSWWTLVYNTLGLYSQAKATEWNTFRELVFLMSVWKSSYIDSYILTSYS